MSEAFQILVGQSCNQIKMQMNIIGFFQFLNHCPNPVDSCIPSYMSKSVFICRLHTNFHLNRTRSQCPKQLKLLLRYQIRLNLKMKICNSIIMLPDISPDFHCMLMITIKGSVHKFDLCNLIVKKELQFPLNHFQIPESYGFIN